MALPGYPDVTEALSKTVANGELGVQVAAYLRDELIADSWIGVAAEAPRRPVDASTLFSIFSVTKGLTAVAVHLQAERGLINYDEPVATYWPEYGAHGKDRITVRHVLTHRAGVPQMPPGVTADVVGDWSWVTERLADMTPVFAAGTRNAYHVLSLGWILGEVVRRTDPSRRPFGQFVCEEICAPLGIDSYWIGLPDGEEARVATLVSDAPAPAIAPDSLMAAAVPEALRTTPDVFNRSEVRRACIPAAGGIANARSLARLYAMLANRGSLAGTRLLSEDTVLSFLEPRPGYDTADALTGAFGPISMGGFYLDALGIIAPFAPGRRVLYSLGAGSSFACADVDSGLAIAICHNRMAPYAPGVEGPLWPIASVIQALFAVRGY